MTPPPVFLVGAPRSGSSLVYKLLCLHPDAAWLSNWVRRLPMLPHLAAANRLARRQSDTRHTVWFGHDGSRAYAYGRARGLAERAFPQPIEGEPLFQRVGMPADGNLDGPADQVAQQLTSAIDTVTRWSGSPVFVNKRIGHNRRIHRLADALPTARFVHIVRDGRAVANSLIRVDWWPDEVLWWHEGDTPAGLGRIEDLTLAAGCWVAEVEVTLQRLAELEPERVLTVRYEDLIADPRPRLDELARFSGLSTASSEWKQALDRVAFPDRTENWRERWEATQREAVNEIERSLLDRLGYEL